MTESISIGKQILASQPFSVLLGAELVCFEPGRAELAVPIRPELLQQFDFVHGGVISFAADNALTFAGGSVLGPQILTLEFKINYLRPAKGSLLRAEATVASSSARHAICQCNVYAVDGEKQSLVAVAQGTIAIMSKPAEGEPAGA